MSGSMGFKRIGVAPIKEHQLDKKTENSHGN